MTSAARASAFPTGFFDRADPTPDTAFYDMTRLVTHIDDHAIAAVRTLYAELDVIGDVVDLMSSWVSHLPRRPRSLTALGMNRAELDANPQADRVVTHDLNADHVLPFADESFDDALCCVSVDYLVGPVQVFAEVARVLRPGGRFVCTFSNRCFPTKAIRGWLSLDDAGRFALVGRYFELTGAFEPATFDVRVSAGLGVDPLYAVWATVA